jgi:hypothetical protein
VIGPLPRSLQPIDLAEAISMNKFSILAAALAFLAAVPSHAAIVISEVAPWSSSNSPFSADWFEITNTGPSPVSTLGWVMDDNSHTNASAVQMRGISSIAAGQSAVFVEGLADGSTDAALVAAFKSAWFGANVPASFVIGVYGGSGVGLSTAGDEVNIYTSTSGSLVAGVVFGASNNVASPFQTFDNAAGNSTVTQLSVAGVNGAFQAADTTRIMIGSPGSVSAVPESSTLAMTLAGLVAVAAAARRRA